MDAKNVSLAEVGRVGGRSSRLFGLLRWWPLGMGSAAMVFVYAAYLAGFGWLASRPTHEVIAPALLLVPLTVFLLQAAVYRSEFHLFMGCLCVALFCRELHFTGTSTGIYVALAVLGLWWARRGEYMETAVAPGILRRWLIGTGACYLLSQIIARRVFRYVGLPLEDELHVYLEETVETTAHLMLLTACFLLWRTGKRAFAGNRHTVRAGGDKGDGRRRTWCR